MGSVFTIWLHKVCFSRVPRALIRWGAAIPVTHPCKYTMQRHLSAGVNAPGLAHGLSSSALKTYWACVREPHVNARVLLLITMLFTVCPSARQTCFTERKDCSVWDEATNKMLAMCFVVRILFSIHHDERVCHVSHGKHLECVTYDLTNNEKYFWYVVFVNKTQKIIIKINYRTMTEELQMGK